MATNSVSNKEHVNDVANASILEYSTQFDTEFLDIDALLEVDIGGDIAQNGESSAASQLVVDEDGAEMIEDDNFNQKKLFDLCPDLRKSYAKKKSKESRERIKAEEDCFIKENFFLTMEQDILKAQVDKLKHELAQLPQENERRDPILSIENKILQSQIKKRRVLLDRVSAMYKNLPASELEDLSAQLAEIDQGGAEPFLEVSEEAAESWIKECLAILSTTVVSNSWASEPISVDEIRSKYGSEGESSLFSTLQKIDTKANMLPEGCSFQTANQLTFRVDLKGLNLGTKDMALLLKKAISSTNKHHESMSYLHKYLFGSEVKYSRLDIDFENLSLAGYNEFENQEQKRTRQYLKSNEWILSGGKEVRFSAMRHERPVGHVAHDRIYFTSFGFEVLAHHGFCASELGLSNCKGQDSIPISILTESSVGPNKLDDEAFIITQNELDASLSNLTIIGRRTVDIHALKYLFREKYYSLVLSVRDQAVSLGVLQSNIRKFAFFWMDHLNAAS